MTETLFEHLRHVLDEALDMVNAGLYPDELIEEAIAGFDQIEEDAAVGAAVRECDERGLGIQSLWKPHPLDHLLENDGYEIYDPNSPRDPTDDPYEGITLPEALADWKLRNEVKD